MADLVVTLSGNEAKLYQAMQRIIDQQGGVEKGFQKVKRASKDASDNLKNDSKSNQSALDAIGTSIVGIGASYLSFSSALTLASNAAEAIIERQQRSHTLWKDAARSQEDALKNFTGMNPNDMQNILTIQVPKVAREVGFADIPKIVEAYGEGYSAVADVEALGKVVPIAASLTRSNPLQLPPLVGAAMDMSKSAQTKDPLKNVAALLSVGKAARVADPEKLYLNAARAANFGALNNPLMDPEFANRQGMAIFARTSSELSDVTGEMSRTATGSFLAGISKFFKDRGQRGDPIDFFERVELIRSRPELQKEISEHPFGGTDAWPVFEKFLGIDKSEKGVAVWNAVKDALSEITFDPSITVEKQKQMESLTPQLSMETSELKVAGAIEALKYSDTPGALRTSMAQMTYDALNATYQGVGGYVSDTMSWAKRGFLLGTESDSIGESSIADLYARRASYRWLPPTPENEAKVGILDQTIAEVRKLNEALQTSQQRMNDLAQETEKAAKAKREEVEALESARRTAAKQRNAGSIREE